MVAEITLDCGSGWATTSTMPLWLVHVLWIVPPVLGLLFASLMCLVMGKIDVTDVDDDESDSNGMLIGDKADTIEHLGEIIQKGAERFLITEYIYMGVYIVIFSILIIIFYLCQDSTAVGVGTMVAFIVGAVTSILCGYIGMAAAVRCNSRTTFKCWTEGFTDGLITALQGGSVMGFGLCSLGVLVLYCIVMIFRLEPFFGCQTVQLCEALAGFGLGGSSIALFGRVGGGIYTKAADVGADLSGKNEYGMEEDDPRNPACIADNVGDNVGDIAGMGADLFGSFAESTVAAMIISAHGTKTDSLPSLAHDMSGLFFPVLISSSGILVGIITMLVIFALARRCVRNLSEIERLLKLMLIISTVLQTPVVIGLGVACLPQKFALSGATSSTNWACICCVLMGLWSGLFIGLLTEYYTSHSYSPVREIASSQVRSAATGIIYGLALGYLSCILPVISLVLVIVVSHMNAGWYGISLAALGMLSTLTIGLTIDAYGPISDNAGGIAEMARLSSEVREYTDALDAAGNTTAAIGKGFAIGSAALVALALFGAFKERAGIDVVNVAEPWTFGGLFLGALLPYAFSALTMKSVGLAAQEMVDECMEQFPGIINDGAQPNYDRCIAISTHASLREMILPGLLVIFSPLIIGLAFGKNCVAGLLAGALVSGVHLAISMSNSGGAWDNSKKFIKANGLEQTEDDIVMKSPEWVAAHKNSVTGDTVGDPLKDTSGPSLNILVKLSAITSLVFANVIADATFSSPSGGPAWL